MLVLPGSSHILMTSKLTDEQGWQPIFVVLVAPLFFGAAHLHHLREYTVVMCIELKSAAVMVSPFLLHAVQPPVRL